MLTVIALTLFFAGATSGLGARQNLRRALATRHPAAYAGLAVGAAMAAWFAFAGVWLLLYAR